MSVWCRVNRFKYDAENIDCFFGIERVRDLFCVTTLKMLHFTRNKIFPLYEKLLIIILIISGQMYDSNNCAFCTILWLKNYRICKEINNYTK